MKEQHETIAAANISKCRQTNVTTFDDCDICTKAYYVLFTRLNN